ncbi:MAG: diphosphomevalonate decarboxylase [Tenacibaculum sp.]|nr:diphosphomevalonate decarboxylase [Tenacibaculum sp.]
METSEFIFIGVKDLIDKAKFTWKTPSNIALVKYWGKTNPQIPKNASISFTLNNCHTTTTMEFEKSSSNKIDFELYFEGQKKDEFKPKIKEFFNRILKYCSYLTDYKIIINSKNSFPHSSGIASSASGMSAIAMCLMSLERELNPSITNEFFNKKASFLARLGSGSASRSIEGDVVVWGSHSKIEKSSNLYGIKFPYKIHSAFKDYQDTILLVDKGEKQVSSTVGHNLMHNHPYAEQRFKQANENVLKLSEILQNGNIKEFINLVESEALTLHAMMLTSNPYFILMKPNTLQIINKIWEYRAKNNSNVCFTLDAGANVHLLYPLKEKKQIEVFIKNELADFCDKGQNICDNLGFGAKEII